MFHFRRRTLWIIIYITIPMIIILNNLGSDPDVPENVVSASSNQRWSLDNVEVRSIGSVQWLALPSADSLIMSIVLNAIPSTSLAVDNSSAFSSQLQGGKLVLTLTNPVNKAVLEESLLFLEQWLPGNIESIVVSGPFNTQWAELIDRALAETRGEGIEINISSSRGLAHLTSPPMQSQDQLAFLMAVSIIKQRLSGYDIQMSWDHRRERSVVTFNSTLSTDVLFDVNASEFKPIYEAFVESAKARNRTQSQLHRYLQTAIVYNVPFRFFVEQPERLANVSIKDVNRMMEYALEQIKTPQ
ncbi:hypothetical protein QWZ13_05325 [Reinekea marina]|uniref:Uncharacterized protein n=1 Tax=Reinekea marina TaxID=1310421 RepID=A0ABV7WLB8_9GAMM|nr:hypothetical protein [Reinekea marina]MDN3648326.1 hypothetical protein [Reinekea marina]